MQIWLKPNIRPWPQVKTTNQKKTHQIFFQQQMKEEKDHIIILDKTKRKQLKIPKMQTHMQKLRKDKNHKTPSHA